MSFERFKPGIDKLFWWISIPTAMLMLGVSAVSAIFEPSALFITIPVTLFVAYFIISPLFGYAELREKTLFVKFGFFLKREIPYASIRGIDRCRKFYSDSMLSLKNTLDHLNVKYNRFDILSVSFSDNEGFIERLNEKIQH